MSGGMEKAICGICGAGCGVKVELENGLYFHWVVVSVACLFDLPP